MRTVMNVHFLKLLIKNGKIPLPNKGTLRLNPFIYNKEGEKIPNPIAGRCGYKGCTIEHPEVGCGTWFTL
jgi:hypothetical protein